MNIITRSQAKINGLSRYFTGKPCKHGHIAERRVSDLTCLECSRKSTQDYFANNTQTCLKRNKRRYVANKDTILQKNKEYLQKNWDKYQSYYNEYSKQHYQDNKALYYHYYHSRRASIKQATPTWCEVDKIVQLFKESMGYDVHHIVPLQERSDIVCGLHCLANLVALPQSIHSMLHGNPVLMEESWTWDAVQFDSLILSGVMA